MSFHWPVDDLLESAVLRKKSNDDFNISGFKI